MRLQYEATKPLNSFTMVKSHLCYNHDHSEQCPLLYSYDIQPLCCESVSMEINSKQELTDYRLLCLLCIRIDKLGEMYTRDVAMEMQAEAMRGERKRCEIHFKFNFIRHSQLRFRFDCDSI